MPTLKYTHKPSTLLLRSTIVLFLFLNSFLYSVSLPVFADQAAAEKTVTHTKTAAPAVKSASAVKEAPDDFLLKQKRFQPPAGWEWSTFKNADGATIRYGHAETTEAPLGTIVLVTGFTEFGEVYFELINHMIAKHWNVYEMDWRGEGGSDRYLADREKAYSLGFDHDANDLAQFIDTVVKPTEENKIVLVGHSLGSHIALRYLHDHPDDIYKAILSAPALDFTGSQDPNLVSLMCWYQCTTGNGEKYIENQGNWAFMEPKISKMETHSHDIERVHLEAAWANKNPSLRSGGATWKWLQEYAKSLDLLWSKDYLAKIKTPVLVGCPGNDAIIRPYKMRQCVRKLPHVEIWEVPGGRHDLFLEADYYRDPFVLRALDFARI